MNFTDFYEHHRPALEADRPRHYMLLDALAEEAGRPSMQFRGWTFGSPGACAIQPLRDWAIMLGDLTEAQSRMLAETAATKDFAGVMGPGGGPDWFAACATGLGVALSAATRNRIHVLDGPPRAPGIAGSARSVTAGDAALFFEWMRRYMREALPHDPVPDATCFARWAAEGNYLFWIVNGRPVSVAGIVSESKDGAAITGVYTPATLRGRGYAAAVTAAAAQRILSEGRRQIYLMANDSNAPALRCYARLGFQPVTPFTHYWRRQD